MDTATTPKKNVHHGRNVRCLRELLDKNQAMLADKLNISQQAVSQLEQQEQIAEDKLKEIADALAIPIEAIKNMTEEKAINMVGNTFTDFKDNDGANFGYGYNNNHQTFNAVEKFTEMYDRMMTENREKLHALEKELRQVKREYKRTSKD